MTKDDIKKLIANAQVYEKGKTVLPKVLLSELGEERAN
jgi:hypothetical protein